MMNLVNDVTDLNLATNNQLEPKISTFETDGMIHNVKSMFNALAKLEHTEINFISVKNNLIMDRSLHDLKLVMMMPKNVLEDNLPKYLRGDKVRFT